MIHPTAIIHPGAKLGTNVIVGPYARIEDSVVIGDNTTVGSHAVIETYTEIGENCRIFPHAVVGGEPQALKFDGEVTYTKIGRGTIIREFVTINRGTAEGTGITEVGEQNLIMACSHIAHDCKTGKGVIMANVATLAGHIEVGDYATVGGLTAVHQFVRIGAYAFIGGTSAVVQDIPPYVMASGNRVDLHGLNTVGLNRHGFNSETVSILKKVYRIFFRTGLTIVEADRRVRSELPQISEVKEFLSFVTKSQRGLSR